MSWKPEVIADSGGKWTGNACRFATEAEAREYVLDLMMRWTAVRDTRQVECDDPVNYHMVDGRARPIPAPQPEGLRTIVFDEQGPHDLGVVTPENLHGVLKNILDD